MATVEQIKKTLVDLIRPCLNNSALLESTLDRAFDALNPWPHDQRNRFLLEVISEACSNEATQRPTPRGMPFKGKAYTGATTSADATGQASAERLLAKIAERKQAEK